MTVKTQFSITREKLQVTLPAALLKGLGLGVMKSDEVCGGRAAKAEGLHKYRHWSAEAA
jgi:hypothetical protein